MLKKIIDEVYDILKLNPRLKNTVSRRAQEYEAKIFQVILLKAFKVVRDLFRKNTQSEQSLCERQMFQVAIERLKK